MTDHQSPHQKLRLFRDKIGIEENEAAYLDQFRPLFVGKKDEFADYFHAFFFDMPDTRTILEGEKETGLMKRVWSRWFEWFFDSRPDDDFLAYLWKVGVRHVEVNLDQRFSNLGFALIRQFCHKVVLAEIPPDQGVRVLSTIDKMVDICLLAETMAYIENTVSCDIEVMSEVADRVRNPAMVIGWNIRKMQDRVTKGTAEHKIYEMLMTENQRLEDMVNDIKVYMDMFQSEPEPQVVKIEELIDQVLRKLGAGNKYPNVKVDTDFNENAKYLRVDPVWFEYLFFYIIQNSMEAADKEKPYIRISSQVEKNPPHNIRIEIFNSGNPPQEEVEKLFTPFFSTKATGTGFGLPIARLIIKKHHGALTIGPAEGQLGTSVIITLPNVG